MNHPYKRERAQARKIGLCPAILEYFRERQFTLAEVCHVFGVTADYVTGRLFYPTLRRHVEEVTPAVHRLYSVLRALPK